MRRRAPRRPCGSDSQTALTAPAASSRYRAGYSDPSLFRAEWKPPPNENALFLLRFAERRRLGQGEEQDLFAGAGADVVVQAHHLGAGGLLHQRLHDGPRRLDQMGAYLLEQVPPLLGRE